jgi:acyl-CoA synthetase (AMP-forming)/AMP-acid ligase II
MSGMRRRTAVIPSGGRPESSVRSLLAQRRDATPQRAAFVEGCSGRRVTWGQIAAAAADWTEQRPRLGVAPLARVGVVMADPLAAATTHLAALAAGVTVAPLNPQAPADELAAEIRTLGLSAVVTDGMALADLDDLAAAGAQVWVSGPGRLHLARLRPWPVPSVSPGPAALIMASSGTTGTRKIIPLSEAQLLGTAVAVARHHQLTADDRGYCPLPLFHINALVVGVLSTLVAGSTLVLDSRFSRSGFWAVAGDHDVTWLNLVPAIIGLLADSAPPPAGVADRIRFARSASAPLAPGTLGRFEGRCGISVLETYGMTEAASQIAANPLDPRRRRPGSVGLGVGTEIRIVDEGGQGVPLRSVGAVEIRGERVANRYWASTDGGLGERPAQRAGGWLSTGDLGRFDEDGFLYLVGRTDDVINRGGEKIYPGEIEAVLLGDPRVTAAVVVGRRHPIVGEEPVAFVVANVSPAGRAPLGDDLHRRCARALSPFRAPVDITVAETLPAGPTGKVRRADVRRLAAQPPATRAPATQPPATQSPATQSPANRAMAHLHSVRR